MELFGRRCILSPLILAIIFITFFHNVLSRHRIRHFKDRFKRQQGAHLYLPGSFVTDDETPEAGAWEDWSAPSPCSRTCGGGVATQSRRCKPGYECQGPSRKYFSCSTQDCPEPADFRAQQCADYDHIPFEGMLYEWVPYTKAPNQCELNCMPKGDRFYYRHATAVVDGTRCNDEKFDVCASGKCHPVGCDRMLGSTAREDQCRVCGGDGTSCNTFTNTIQMKDMQVGYNDILLIPAGATNIRVEELAPSNNYLAIRNKTGHYYLNGNWRIDFPRSLDFARSRFKYERTPQEFDAPDIITALGPTDESLFFSLLYQGSYVPITYTYSLPTNVPPPSTETYSWTYDEFTPCSATCGGGYQFRNVSCAGRNSLEPADRSLCDSSTEPEAKKRCGEIPCQAQWIPYPWKECSAPCGEGGVQERDIFCQQIVSNGIPSLADDSECLKVEPRPAKEQKCNVGKICAKWHTGPWKPCDHLCGDGKQTRKVQCYIEKDDKIEVLEDAECEAITPRPIEAKKCRLRPCEGVDWITSEWSGCDRICGLKNETRKVYCATAEGEILSDEICESEQPKPEIVRKCESMNTTCQYLWYASQWSECSVTCGKGVQTRTVFCGVATVDGVQKVESDQCDPSKNFETIKNCTGENEECEGEWFSGPWGKCSKPCGGGERTKKVLCIKDDEVIDPSACGSDKIVFSHEDCNRHPCSEDTIMPTDVTHPVDESEPTEDTSSTRVETTPPSTEKPSGEPEEYEIVPDTNCDDGEWVEVPILNSPQNDEPKDRLEIDREMPFQLEELMLNDGPGINEGEEGSGSGSTDSSFTTLGEGSGSVSTDESTSDSTEENTTPDSLITTPQESIEFIGESEVGARTVKPVSSVPKTSNGRTTSTIEMSEDTTEFTDNTEESTDGTTEITVTSSSAESSSVAASSTETSVPPASTNARSTYQDTTNARASSIEAIYESTTTSSDESSDVTTSTEAITEITTESTESTSTVTSSGTEPSSSSTNTETTNARTTTTLTTNGRTSSTEAITEITTESTESSSAVTSSVTEPSSSSTNTETTNARTTTTQTTNGRTSSTEAITESTTESTSSPIEITDTTETSSVASSSTEPSSTSASTETTNARTTNIQTTNARTSGTEAITESTRELTESTEESTNSPIMSTETTDTTSVASSSTEPSSTSASTDTTNARTTNARTTNVRTTNAETSSTEAITESTSESTESTEESTSSSPIEITDTTESSSVASSSTEPSSTPASTETTNARTTHARTTNARTTNAKTSSTEAITESTTESTESTEESTSSSLEITDSTETSSVASISTEPSSTPVSTETTNARTTNARTTNARTTNAKISSTEALTESTTESAESTEESTSSSIEITDTKETSSVESSSTEPSSTGTTNARTTNARTTNARTTNVRISSTEGISESTSISTESTDESTESTTEVSSSTEISITPESTESEITGSDIFSGSTESGITEESTYSELYGTTPIISIFRKTQKMCKRRKIKTCRKTEYGCCWDNITPAKGPFDKGCPTPHTCKESKYGCCEDGVSPALGPKFVGCPSEHCNETLFGCCPDNKTIAEGNDYEGCPPQCLMSEYGCCNDNITEALGSDHEGCEEAETTTESTTVEVTESSTTEMTVGSTEWTEETETSTVESTSETTVETTAETTTELIEQVDCSNTTYRCCPDSITPATGPGFQGCNLSCSNSTFGCCQDGQTSAHGPSGEGCCLLTQFGCCPDNIVAARGPNGQGCGCEVSPYGCCPDNKTSAQGYNQEGCGCRFTPFGCCPDNLAPAFGPDFLGCSCGTFQFGCCPDGVSIARGPLAQGCGCRDSEFGCCSDEKTPARGPNSEGCGCESTKFGCCIDGVSEAKGENFEGCESTPENLQAGCSLPKQRGNCRDFKVKWFFDMEYGGCSRFWYGGCDGNENRFNSKEECDNVCVKPQDTDVCGLPKVRGPCEGYYPVWYYDNKLKNCAPFVYGGCLGNNNRFETREACLAMCVKDVSADPCEQTKEEGPCRGQYQRYFFDKSTSECNAFVYGGCKGNSNNFPTVEACNQKCNTPGVRKEKDTCQLPADVGGCANYVDRWFYETFSKTCRQFYYGGCGGNGNNFETYQQCQQRCENPPPPVEQPEPEPQTEPQVQPTSGPEQPEEPFRTEMCFLSSETGPCRAALTKYYYDSSEGVCKTFIYGGCRGNRNRFEDELQCLQYCGNAQDVCTLPPVHGPCNGSYVQYYFDARSDSCQPFDFGGCGGNYNRFQDQVSCEQQCKKTPQQPIVTQAPPIQHEMCQQDADPGNCTDNSVAFFYDRVTSKCTPFTYTGCGGNDNRFNSEEQCERQCGVFRGQAICEMERDPGPCNGYFVKYYYNKDSGRCEQFAFGGCQGNGNRFSSSEECEHICVIHDESKPNITNTAPPVIATDSPIPACQEAFNECTNLRCPYGVEPYVDENDCNRCRCRDPCMGVECSEDEQCAIDINMNRTTPQDAEFIAICRKRVKPGSCPNLLIESDQECQEECRTDADCTLHLKCCSTGCGTACVDPTPAQLVTQRPEPAFTDEPVVVPIQPPKLNPMEFKPEVSAPLGDQAILTCAVSGNPNPRIRWSKENLEIDGTQPRYRIRLDQSLQIITLHKTDSGTYLCTAENGIGDPITNEIRLDVVDSGPRPATMLEGAEDEPPLIVSLNAPTSLNCFVLGNPFPAVTWWKDDSLIPYDNNEFRIGADNSLLIHSVKLHNLGIYTCQAYNGYGTASSWSVVVKARGPYHFTNPRELIYKQFIVDSPDEPTPSTPSTTTTTTTPIPPPPSRYPPYVPPPQPYPPFVSFTEPSNEIIPGNLPDAGGEVGQPSIIVPVRANITTSDQRYPVGSDIEIPCSVTGYPLPQVQWYKDGIQLSSSEKIQVSDTHTLTIIKATKADSGYYQCEATNAYTKSTSTLEILIEGMYIHPSCTDNPFFANCGLIVKAKFCSHKYYGKFCCRSCAEAGLLSTDGSNLNKSDKQFAIDNNSV